MPQPDSTDIGEVKRWLDEQRIRYSQPTEYHIKVGPYNFYPEKKGTITLDGQKAVHSERGFEAFKALVLKLKARNPRAIQLKTNRSKSRENEITDERTATLHIEI